MNDEQGYLDEVQERLKALREAEPLQRRLLAAQACGDVPRLLEIVHDRQERLMEHELQLIFWKQRAQMDREALRHAHERIAALEARLGLAIHPDGGEGEVF